MATWRATVDGRKVQGEVRAAATLAEAIRAVAAEAGVKIACGEGTCGACSALVGGVRVHACIYPALRAQDQEIQTVASFADGPVARALAEHGGVQCGFCSPGMVVAVHAAGSDVPATPDGLRAHLSGNLCRCTGYGQLVDGAVAGLTRLRGQAAAPAKNSDGGR